MKISFVAGFGPIVREMAESRAFWEEGLGVRLEEPNPGYFTNDELEGVNAFALWPLAQAVESCFGTNAWPEDVPTPAAWLEFDVESADAVAPAAAEMVERGHRLLKESTLEPWGQTVARLLSPEGILVGIAFTPWMHKGQPGAEEPPTA
jgi:catechol 2,3-dioxygenase-like lactoylglutathione lyase family enzyme